MPAIHGKTTSVPIAGNPAQMLRFDYYALGKWVLNVKITASNFGVVKHITKAWAPDLFKNSFVLQTVKYSLQLLHSICLIPRKYVF